MSFRVTGLDPTPFRHLYGASNAYLAAHGVRRCVADTTPGFPDRVELRDADIGETLLLLNYTHQPAANAYFASHAIFVREGAIAAFDAGDVIPTPLRVRPISLRAFDAAHDMIEADLVDGSVLDEAIRRLLGNDTIAYLHAHYAKRGCYAARIDRN